MHTGGLYRSTEGDWAIAAKGRDFPGVAAFATDEGDNTHWGKAKLAIGSLYISIAISRMLPFGSISGRPDACQ